MKQWIERSAEVVLQRTLQTRPAVVITGPRQAGKTSILRHTLPHARWLRLDDPRQMQALTLDPAMLLEPYEQTTVIDEFQYAPECLRYVKLCIDDHRQRKGQFALTGSQIFQTMHTAAESLAGRVGLIELLPLSWREIAQLVSPYDSERVIEQSVTGFYP